MPALSPRSIEVAIHRKYKYKVTLNIKIFKALRCILTLVLLILVNIKLSLSNTIF